MLIFAEGEIRVELYDGIISIKDFLSLSKQKPL